MGTRFPPWAASLTQQGVRGAAGQILAQILAREADGLARIRILTGDLGSHRTGPKGLQGNEKVAIGGR